MLPSDLEVVRRFNAVNGNTYPGLNPSMLSGRPSTIMGTDPGTQAPKAARSAFTQSKGAGT